jgi:hypothetical protein
VLAMDNEEQVEDDLKQVNVLIPIRLIERVRVIAFERRISNSSIYREALTEWVERHAA